jgi:hypothetical protein
LSTTIQNNDDDKLIKLVQSCTQDLMGSFRDKTELLTKCSDDLKLLIREGYNAKVAKETAEKFFGKKKISFIAIDGTESQDQRLDMLIFYAGAFGYIGQLEFVKEHCSCEEILEPHNVSNVSAAIPVHEEDASNIVGDLTEGGIEVDPERLPSSLMQFAEYYMAVRAAYENPDLKLVLLDRTLAGDVGHLIWRVEELLHEKRSVLEGIETEFGTVSSFDLELARMLHPNDQLHIPAPRSHLIKYAAVNELLMSSAEDGDGVVPIGYKELLDKIGAKEKRLGKLVNDLSWFNESYSFLKEGGDDSEGDSNILAIKPNMVRYWQRVFSATMKVAKHIFETPDGKHPLIYEDEMTHNNNKNRKWITSADLEYMTLVMIYSLLRLAWEKNVLVIGLIKDSAAAELTKTIIPILQNAHKIGELGTDVGGGIIQLPKFNSDKQLLQTSSVVNGQFVKTPWRTFEFDACFRTMAPVSEGINNNKSSLKRNEARVRGAFKNVISAERMFVKSYLQLWQSENDPTVRSHVFSYDRPCYPGLDIPGELLLYHSDSNIDEEIQPMIHFDKDSNISHLVMDILCSMSLEVIPECLGHNYPLFLADKKAKYVLNQMKTAYLSTVAFEMADSEFDQQVLYEARFRDFRSQMENARRSKS